MQDECLAVGRAPRVGSGSDGRAVQRRIQAISAAFKRSAPLPELPDRRPAGRLVRLQLPARTLLSGLAAASSQSAGNTRACNRRLRRLQLLCLADADTEHARRPASSTGRRSAARLAAGRQCRARLKLSPVLCTLKRESCADSSSGMASLPVFGATRTDLQQEQRLR